MTAMDRTAYPRLGERLTREELRARYNLADADLTFIRANARGDVGRLTLAMVLKTRQNLGCFPALRDVHADTVAYLALQIEMTIAPPLLEEKWGKTTLHRYRTAVRAYLGVTAYADAGERLVTSTILEIAETMSDPADLINRAIEELREATIDLPAFSTLERLANRLRILGSCPDIQPDRNATDCGGCGCFAVFGGRARQRCEHGLQSSQANAWTCTF